MKKNFKLLVLSFVLIASFLTSCTNDEPLIEDQNIDESEAIITSLNQLNLQFNSQGNMIPSQNPTGNIVFDFCFDFVYPLNLSYNNGTTVTVESLDDLINVMINSTNDLYINGIEFPFDVETYSEDSDAIVVVTINNEEEFVNLLENCDFDEFECECFEDYTPVCVEIEAPDGELFTITYPNACYAECDGFTENDFVENCETDYNGSGGFECFTFNFPLTIVTDSGATITVNSQEELDTSLYNSYYFDFVYPFDVTLENDEIVTIGSAEEFEGILEDCFDVIDDCVCPEVFDPVCVQIEEDGVIYVETFPNACYAECLGFSSEDYVDCENQSSDCSADELSAILVECIWYSGNSLYENVAPEYFEFGADGSLSVTNSQTGETSVIGTWSVSGNPSGQVFMFFTSSMEPYTLVTELDWTVIVCDDGFIALESGNEYLFFEQDCE